MGGDAPVKTGEVCVLRFRTCAAVGQSFDILPSLATLRASMSFFRPYLLLLLALPVLLGLWEWWRRGLRVRLPFDHGSQRNRVRLEASVKLANLLPALLLAVAVFFLAGPRRSHLPEAEKEIKNIQFCLDMSGSMDAGFGDAKRYNHALRAIEEFCAFRKDGAFGLSVFGTEVIHWVPVTRDLAAIRLSAPLISPGMFPPFFGGTMIGKALRSVIKRMESLDEGDRTIILISDGESSDLEGGAAEQIGSELASANITLFYIHMAEGQPQDEVGRMCSLSGGESFIAGDPEALQSVFARIDAMNPARMKPPAPEFIDHFQPWCVTGLAALGAYVLSLFGLRFSPW
jgi:Ca-activated chloride channel family protein